MEFIIYLLWIGPTISTNRKSKKVILKKLFTMVLNFINNQVRLQIVDYNYVQ